MLQAWKNASLRSQLVAIISALLLVTLLALGAATYILLHAFLVDQMNSQLSAFRNSSAVRSISAATSDASSVPLDYYLGYYDADGAPLAQNRSGKDHPNLGSLSLADAEKWSHHPVKVPSNDGGDPWQAVIIAPASIAMSNGGVHSSVPGYVVVALPYEPLNDTMERLAVVVLAVTFLAVTLGTLIAYWTVSRSFRPLSRVEKTAAAIAAGDLSRRVEIENPATEVGRLSGSLNAMLAHIETAFAARTASESRMRQFVADASHELRTPLVTIRGFSELYRQGALQTVDDVTTAMGRIESEAKRMGQLVEDLLMLARIDEQRPLRYEDVDLLLLGHDAAVDARATAPNRSITVTGLVGPQPAHAPVTGDEAKIRQVIANLMGNALRYTPEGSPIEIAVGVRGKYAVLELRDHGPGISEEESPRIFERFYRADSSRNRNTGGSGLGLAIVAAIVAAHGGTVRMAPTPGGGATLTVSLPSESAPAAEMSN